MHVADVVGAVSDTESPEGSGGDVAFNLVASFFSPWKDFDRRMATIPHEPARPVTLPIDVQHRLDATLEKPALVMEQVLMETYKAWCDGGPFVPFAISLTDVHETLIKLRKFDAVDMMCDLLIDSLESHAVISDDAERILMWMTYRIAMALIDADHGDKAVALVLRVGITHMKACLTGCLEPKVCLPLPAWCALVLVTLGPATHVCLPVDHLHRLLPR